MLIKDINMSARTTEALKLNGIETTEKLVKLRTDEVMRFRNFGRMSLQELLGKMKELNISFVD